ncbi:zinc ribbon domain-containing protein [Ideonella azotifigens]|uniref:Zinc ribbon domain-containing protein n=1 Tax=Ideonella azotifigens TaxID=513160 RepID=A0ABN1JVG2_9BURK|nr:zinc ribbon domain-containing protein [Ideonella azotifigens]MCD2343271.1 zinc ribbon domain-containing protein [Ideonella azotifigens]
MPLYDYHCPACLAEFEVLVRAGTVPTCPHCGATTLERAVSRIAPAGKIEAIRMSNRRQAAREGHFSHLSTAERNKLLKLK